MLWTEAMGSVLDRRQSFLLVFKSHVEDVARKQPEAVRLRVATVSSRITNMRVAFANNWLVFGHISIQLKEESNRLVPIIHYASQIEVGVSVPACPQLGLLFEIFCDLVPDGPTFYSSHHTLKLETV